MISDATVREIKRLLAEGSLSQRKIARVTGVSRGTVGAIAAGRRSEHGEPPRSDESGESSGPPERCPTCGAIVHPPCRFCGLQSLLATQRIPRRPERQLGPIGLELCDEHRSRYEKVRARCRRRGERRAGSKNASSTGE